jgi:tRNA A-37 threonylcarbamoyl transferase component Bud32
VSQILRGREWARRLQAALGPGEADPADWMSGHADIIKQDPHSLVGLISLEGRACYLKYYRAKRSTQGLLLRFGRGRGIASFDNALALRRAGLDVPEPLACLRTRRGLMLLTEAIEGAADLKALWLAGQSGPRLEALMIAAGDTLARWHARGFTHGDCKWSNFLFARERVLLVDLESVGRGSPASRGARRDLARFVVNAEDMGLPAPPFQAFLESYAAPLGVDAGAIPGRIRSPLEALRRRHRARYGERGQQLI